MGAHYTDWVPDGKAQGGQHIHVFGGNGTQIQIKVEFLLEFSLLPQTDLRCFSWLPFSLARHVHPLSLTARVPVSELGFLLLR